MALDRRVDVRRQRRAGHEDAGRPDRQGKIQRVAETVGEEQLRDAEAAIGGTDAEHAFPEQLSAHHHVVMQVHAALRGAGAARRIEPERGRIAACLVRHQLGRPFVQQIVERSVPRRRSIADDHDVLERRDVAARDRGDARQQVCVDDRDAGAGIVENVAVVGRLPQRVQRDRHGADLDRAEERGGEGRRVEEEEDDAFFRPDAESVAEGAAAAVDPLGQVGVRHPLVAALDRHRRAPALGGVAIDEVARGVERLGDAEVGGADHSGQAPLDKLDERRILPSSRQAR